MSAPPDSCPRCVAEAGLAQLRAMNAGQDVPALGLKLRGKPLDHSAQAGFAEAFLRQVCEAGGKLCRRHRGLRRAA